MNSVAITSENRFIISGSSDHSIKVFDLHTKQEVHHFQNVHQSLINSIVLTPDNRFIISGSDDKSIKIFDLGAQQETQHFHHTRQGKFVCTISDCLGSVISSASPTSDNGFMVSGFGSGEKSIKVFDLHTRHEELGN